MLLSTFPLFSSYTGIQYGTEHGKEHGTEYGTEHGTEHATENATERGTEHGAWYGAWYGATMSTLILPAGTLTLRVASSNNICSVLLLADAGEHIILNVGNCI